jgi:hypothetical protein
MVCSLVIAISATELADEGAMTNHFRRLARHLVGKDKADEIKRDTNWYRRGQLDGEPTDGPPAWKCSVARLTVSGDFTAEALLRDRDEE